jgi:hypothetical protein
MEHFIMRSSPASCHFLPLRSKYYHHSALEHHSEVLHGKVPSAEKMTVTSLVKKFTAFYGTWSFIAVFTRNRKPATGTYL